MDFAAIAQAAVTFLTPHFLSAAGKAVEGTLDTTREKFLGWLKCRFTKPAQAGALEVAEKAPSDAEALDALRYQLVRALQQDEAFRDELIKQLPKEALPPTIAQTMTITGDGSTGIQITGSGNVVDK